MDELREDQDKERERLKQTISDIESQLQKANIKVKLLTNRCVVGPWYVFLSIIIIYMYLYIFIFVYIYIYIYTYNISLHDLIFRVCPKLPSIALLGG